MSRGLPSETRHMSIHCTGLARILGQVQASCRDLRSKNWAKFRFNLLGKDYVAELARAKEWVDITQGCPSDRDDAKVIFVSARLPFNKAY